ncbi:OLC1v1005584C1 [Oldenlandia corymbosa var. corymbosa]|uniref:OLC1v1005584C1 n=1 Tax=Oldenlandia corymbosa var. corymbosa TaxID=529605 RepID=A0AAV1DGZ4_OLDCO|nr:OLC1v1005584C1 [Oldenlandia corymbosa var. corymbosa]
MSIVEPLTMFTSSTDCSLNSKFSLVPFLRRNPQSTTYRVKRLRISFGKLCAAAGAGNPASSSSSPVTGDALRNLAVSSVVLLVGLGFSHRCLSASAAVDIPTTPVVAPENSQTLGSSEDVETDDMNDVLEKQESEIFPLTVPLRIVALRNSFPPVWFQRRTCWLIILLLLLKDFVQTQGKRVRLGSQFRQSLNDIVSELQAPVKKRDALAAADLITVGDSWLSFLIKEGLIDPMEGVEKQDWFQDLADEWKGYLRRSDDGKLDPQGRVWAAPYRWGSLVIAYKKSKFEKHKLDPIEDWADLWRPELTGKISMVDSPREIVGAVLKYMGASYNTHDITSQVSGGKTALLENLLLLTKQVRLFDSEYYLKAFAIGDVWVAVGWSTDILPAAKRMSNVSVVVPKSGASLWADLWAIPATSKLQVAEFGGRVRGPSPLVAQWIEFCLQDARAQSFKEETIPGASPNAFKGTMEEPSSLRKGRPKLETNLIAGVPPPEILARCEFLEPLPEETLADYRWLIDQIDKPNHSFMGMVQRKFFSVLNFFKPKL